VLKIVDALTAREVLAHSESPRQIQNLRFSPDGKRLGYITCRADEADATKSDCVAKIIETGSGKEVLRRQGVMALEFSADGKLLAILDEGRRAHVCDSFTGDNQHTLPGDNFYWLSFSPDGRWLAAAASTNRSSVTVWDARTFREKQVFKLAKEFQFSPDGRSCIVRETDGVKVIPVEESGAAGLINLRGSRFSTGNFGLDGRGRLASVALSAEHEITLWDIASGETTLKLPVAVPLGELANLEGVNTAVFSADGGRLAIATSDKTVRILDARPLSDELRWEREALGLYRFHADKFLSSDELLENIRRDPEVSEPVRQQALHLAERYPQPIDDEGFIRTWLVLAPMSMGPGEKAAAALDRQQTADEAHLKPRSGDNLRIDQRTLRWQNYRAGTYFVDFNEFCRTETPNAIGYAVCYILCDREHRGLNMNVGSDDQAKIYLNGKEVFKQLKVRAIGKDQDVVPNITLNKGRNVVVFKVINEQWGWAGCMRFTDRIGKPFRDFRVKLVPE
jgi:hypothetical protein